MLTELEIAKLMEALKAWAAQAPREARLHVLGEDHAYTPEEMLVEVQKGTGAGLALLSILEHGVRREGLDSVVDRLCRPIELPFSIPLGQEKHPEVEQALAYCSVMIHQQPSGRRKELLGQLGREMEVILAKLPLHLRPSAVRHLEEMVESVIRVIPDGPMYTAGVAGLVHALGLATNLAGHLTGTIGQLGKLLWPGFKMPKSSSH